MGKRSAPVQSFSARDGGKHQMTQADYYRHQIGRQDAKKLMKQESRTRKRKESERVQKAGAFSYFGSILVGMLAILCGLYFAAYFLIAQYGDEKLRALLPAWKPAVDLVVDLYGSWVKPYLPSYFGK